MNNMNKIITVSKQAILEMLKAQCAYDCLVGYQVIQKYQGEENAYLRMAIEISVRKMRESCEELGITKEEYLKSCDDARESVNDIENQVTKELVEDNKQ